ncbi:ribose-phosphate diphosphokinase [Picrophilus oshimae]|uniref:ribose-phosphate diphosphokinase n=1 Tax=Picrophilus torridus (strain ATCC 700027 / DSM 9790 / JCM 10055 / NBRC 100828 / KAW 2/3) TaxID=1122961 RepID=Q6L0L1_PICTO|nr:ribose-phosphate diphosphokinase [Picrophilus oshimae]AAT43491.1 ribose-phosphate pyrophosphokinase [Picrophilus oshimae DSM 9789]
MYIIVPSSSSMKLTSSLASKLNAEIANVTRKRFPDGEMYVRIETDLKDRDVIVLGNTSHDSDLIEYLLLLNAAYEEKPATLNAVIPYFGYARQHMRYNPGEPVSSKVFTKAIENFADSIMAVEIHDEETLKFSAKPFTNVKVYDSIADYHKNHDIDYVISPDDGGYERAKSIAKYLKVDAYYIEKKRIDSRTVEMKMPDIDSRNRNILIVDDMISTGGTVIKASRILKDSGAKKIYVSAVHGVFSLNSAANIMENVDDLSVSDTIETGYSRITVSNDIKNALEKKIKV